MAGEAGVSVRSLRCHEEQGLLHPERTASGQRAYGDDPSDQATADSVAVMRREHARLSTQVDELIVARDQLGAPLAAASAHQQRETGGA